MPTPTNNRRESAVRILIATIGSAGDVHPKIGLGVALQRRGHRVCLVTGARFRDVCEREGLEFREIAPGTDFERTAEDPDVWHPTRGFPVLAHGAIVPAMRPLYETIRRQRESEPDTVVLASSLCLGARLAHEKLGVPLATVHMQPIVLRSVEERVGTPHPRFPRRGPRWAKRLAYWIADRTLIDRALNPELGTFRQELGLSPVRRAFDGWVHSPELVLGLWPRTYGPPLSDWPPNVELCGFPVYDPPSLVAPPAPDLERFLESGPAPVLFTAGSGHLHPGEFFAMAEAVARRLDVRALLVSPTDDRPAMDPSRVHATAYVPFELVLPRCRAIVHHGGVGTTARALAHGLPQVIVPFGFDQPDNARRVEHLERGRAVFGGAHRRGKIAAALGHELQHGKRDPWSGPQDYQGIERATGIVQAWLERRNRA